MKSKYIWLLGAMMIGCGNAQNTNISGTWYLQTLNDNGNQVNIKADQNSAFITFEGKTINGNAGCNQFFANYSLKGDKINIAKAGITRMMCDNESMLIEDSLTKIISDGTSSISINGNELSIQKAGIRATFHK